MNVTIKIKDDVCRAARHRAVDAGLSLSGWVVNLIEKELDLDKSTRGQSLLELLGSDEFSDVDFEFPRLEGRLRDVDFS